MLSVKTVLTAQWQLHSIFHTSIHDMTDPPQEQIHRRKWSTSPNLGMHFVNSPFHQNGARSAPAGQGHAPLRPKNWAHNFAMSLPTKRRILLLNPNTNTDTTERLRSVLTPHVPDHVEWMVRTARFGANYIACEASHAVAAHACLDAWAHWRSEDPGPLDAIVIACFGDPGLFALRESSQCAVTGLAEASFVLAAQHGPFAVVTGGARWKAMLQRLADNLGYGPLLTHIETVTPSGEQLQADPDMAMRCLGQACVQAAQHGARSVILGGAGLAGYAQRLQAQLPLPLIDSALAGLHVALHALAPPAQRQEDGFWAAWRGMPRAFALGQNLPSAFTSPSPDARANKPPCPR